MATIIPSLSSCVGRMQSGERRLAERLEQKLEDDYLIWYDVPVATMRSYPDFVVLHPQRGLLILEVKDWKIATVLQADRGDWQILGSNGPKTVISPLEQARRYTLEIVNALERDPQLVNPPGHAYAGKLRLPWTFGVVLPNMTRKQFTDGGLGHALEPSRVICSDEMTETVDAEAFQDRLWQMFKFHFRDKLTLPQIDRIRWILFPEVRVQASQLDLLSDQIELPDIMAVMDVQQEQLARSLGDGHRVIHGVAGSGKTMILGYRAEYLAMQSEKPVLVLCFSEPLSRQIKSVMDAKGLSAKVIVRHFHGWCSDQLSAYHVTRPKGGGERFFAQLVQCVIKAVDRGSIPAAQYAAVLIDEGHDFEPSWFKLVVQMVSPECRHLLVLYDDAQSIFNRSERQGFSFKSVGVQAQGRTTILKINYRNTRQILALAANVAKDILDAKATDDDGVPLIRPISCGREGPQPMLIKLPSIADEAEAISRQMHRAHQDGTAWQDMAIVYRTWSVGQACVDALAKARIPYQWQQRDRKQFSPGADAVSVLTMHASKGLEYPFVAVPGVGAMSTQDTDLEQEARLFYIAATRATHQLLVTGSGDSLFMRKLFPGSSRQVGD
ncbi:Putative ATP-dependent DNA helicase YjcD [Pandoraea eparura]|uniref:ATP-dependent DNA helicase YjcD n=1 Tax=Pandoraea eparura TaxID=2508291 RepID=A0A5E4X1J1_9BURK|nr:3'-5' exonuclease [Pandoraea eparura]VVE30157.1 Putative ATP-dependent DNA helicase YjcD [Pandoraea eparura]